MLFLLQGYKMIELRLTCSVENLRPQPWRADGTRDAPTAPVARPDTGCR
jgi:hypothetical protein